VDAFNWLHLTDVHWGQAGEGTCGESSPEVFEDLKALHDKTGPWHAVLFPETSCSTARRRSSRRWKRRFGPLWEQLQKLGSTPVLLAVPGITTWCGRSERPGGRAWLLREGAFHEIAEDSGKTRRRITAR